MELVKKFFKEWGIPIVSAVILASFINMFAFFNISVPTESMYPTIKPGDKIFCTVIHSKKSIERGDIVVFKSKELQEKLVKRVIGLPGEHIEFKNDGSVLVNGKKLEEPYVQNNSDKEAVFDVPEDSYVFIGDNRNNSLDARFWVEPYIKYDDIKGKARFTILPFSRFGKLE